MGSRTKANTSAVPPRTVVRARFLWKPDGTFLEDAVIEARAGKITSVRRAGRKPPSGESFPDAVILPGLVNAHTHLELTALRGRVRSGRQFHRWLERVRALRAGMSGRDLRRSSADGVEEAIRSGTTTIVDHCHTGSSLVPLRAARIRSHLVLEMIGLAASRIPSFERRYRELRTRTRGHPHLHVGVAPHAPYTASADLYRSARRWIRDGERLSTHLSEHPAEREFLRTGRGDLRWLLVQRDMDVDGFAPPGVSPFEYMQRLGVLRPGTILVHCNYVRPEEIRLIRRAGVPVVYCPRSHAFFEHPRHPVARMRAAGIPVALGTDSLTSNRTLSILDEMRFLAGRRRDLSPRDLLEMGTVDGARAVWGKGKIGRLSRGWAADLAVVSLPPSTGGSPEKRMLDPKARVLATYVGGALSYLDPEVEGRRGQDPGD